MLAPTGPRKVSAVEGERDPSGISFGKSAQGRLHLSDLHSQRRIGDRDVDRREDLNHHLLSVDLRGTHLHVRAMPIGVPAPTTQSSRADGEPTLACIEALENPSARTGIDGRVVQWINGQRIEPGPSRSDNSRI